MDTPTLSYGDRDIIDVTVIIVNYNTAHLLGRMFAALDEACGTLRLQVVVVDNASRDNSVAVLRTRHPKVELIENPTNVGFGRANNQALALARGRYVLLLNTDAFVSPDTLFKTVDFMDANQQCGVLGVKLVGPDGSLQPSCRYFPTPWNVFLFTTGIHRFFPAVRLVDDMTWNHASIRECDWVPGCYYLTRRAVIEQIGLFDPRYFLYYEEVDHCRAVRNAGWTVVFYPFTQVVHIGGESADAGTSLTRTGRQISVLQIESELLFFRKYHGTTGLLASVALSVLSNVFKTCNALIQDRDMAKVSASVRQIGIVFKLLAETRLATRSTR